MRHPIQPDPEQISIFRKYGQIRPAACAIGIDPSTLRWRLIAWGEWKPHMMECMGGCGRQVRTKHKLCSVCRRKKDAEARAMEREVERLNEMEISKSAPPRFPDCVSYHLCLDKAARKCAGLLCTGCDKYSKIVF